MAKRKQLIRTESIVRVIEPIFFLRTRYEKEFRDFLEESFIHDQEMVKTMMLPFIVPDPFNHSKAEANLNDHIHRGIAAYRMEKCKADGNKKILETVKMNLYTNRRFYVYDTKTVVTGEYETSDFCTDHEGNTDYVHPKLIKRKHHHILMVTEFDYIPPGCNPHKMMIEDIHCRFLEKRTLDSVPLPYVGHADEEDFSVEYFIHPPIEDSTGAADRYWKQEEMKYLEEMSFGPGNEIPLHKYEKE